VRSTERWIAPLAIGAAALTWAACASRPATSGVAPRTARMMAHFERAGQLHAAMAAGDLDSVQIQARWIAANERGEDMPPKAQPYVEELHAFADLAARAPDQQSAARAVSRIGATCGSCHESLNRGPRYQVAGGPPAGGSALTTRMVRHRWAADRMWEGLIGPSDASWRAGAQVLRDAPLYTDALTTDVARYEPVTKLAWTVHELGTRAVNERDHSARAELYGQLLGTCARCHALLKGAH